MSSHTTIPRPLAAAHQNGPSRHFTRTTTISSSSTTATSTAPAADNTTIPIYEDDLAEDVRVFKRRAYGRRPVRLSNMRTAGRTYSADPSVASGSPPSADDYNPQTSFGDSPTATTSPRRPGPSFTPSFTNRPSASRRPRATFQDASDDEDDAAPSARFKRRRTTYGNTHRSSTIRPEMPSSPSRRPRFASDFTDLDSDIAFRESVLDALSDPEGAVYWQGVYGTDLREIPRTTTDTTTGASRPTTDDERIAHAARLIFETKNAAYLAEQAQRRKDAARPKFDAANTKVLRDQEQRRKDKIEEARRKSIEDYHRAQEEKRQRKEREREAEAQRRLDEEIERSLRQGRDRAFRAAVKEAFGKYVVQWEEWNGEQDDIPWPTVSGGRTDLAEREIRSFMMQGLDLKTIGNREFLARLKEQRVRWHPDKMQQKMGGRNHVEQAVMADITMIFQVIDTLYDDTRKAA